jgi:hypothetical protein
MRASAHRAGAPIDAGVVEIGSVAGGLGTSLIGGAPKRTAWREGFR